MVKIPIILEKKTALKVPLGGTNNNIRLCKNYPKVTRWTQVRYTVCRRYAVGMQYTVGMQYAIGMQYAGGVSAKRSTHTVDLANMGGGNHYL